MNSVYYMFRIASRLHLVQYVMYLSELVFEASSLCIRDVCMRVAGAVFSLHATMNKVIQCTVRLPLLKD